MSALDTIKQALVDQKKATTQEDCLAAEKQHSTEGRKNRQVVKLKAGDIVAACGTHAGDQIITDLRFGTAKLPPETEVLVQVHDVIHLLTVVPAAAV